MSIAGRSAKPRSKARRDMPSGPINIEEWSKKVKDAKIGERLKKGFTVPRIIVLAIVLLIIIFFLIIAPFARLYTDALWFNHLGFQSLFYKTLVTKILMVVVFGLAFFVLLYGNILILRKLSPDEQVELEGSPLEAFVAHARGAWSKLVKWILVIFSILAAFIAGLGWSGNWDVVLRYLNHATYGQKDPIFGKDVSYYLFSYPFIRSLVNWLLGVLFFILVVVALLYILEGGIRLKWGPDMLAPHVKAHLSVLGAAILLVKAWSYRLNMYELLFQKKGVVYGVGYTDAHAHIPALWIMLVVAIAAAVVLLINIRYRGWLLPVIAVGSLIVVTILAGTVYPLIIQNYRVKPNELQLESKYLGYNIDFTRNAYKINQVQVKPYAAEQALNKAGIDKNQATIRNIRLWDPGPLLNTYQQLQAIRQYYVFNEVDVDRYYVDNVYRQTMIGAREMMQGNLPASAKTWVNTVLVYTHGYGACLSPSNDITAEGNPFFFLSNIPPTGTTNVQITRPEIYFGEQSSKYVVVDTTQREFDFPKGAQAQSTLYKGDGGVKVNSIWRKLLFAIRFSDVNLLFSGQVRGSSQVMYVRDISERVAKSAPFLKFDQDPYMVIDDSGRLLWIVDGYTTSDMFPYSQPSAGLGNYVRNSVKCVIDAYNGKVTLYVIDPSDPVIATWQKIFPHLFTPFAEMSPDLRRHLRYPEDLYLAQANIFRTYHMTNPRQFYFKEDEWDFPNETQTNTAQPMAPYYLIMRLPYETGEEMVLFMPFVPHTKQNMIAWLGARMDGDHYGELVNFKFPSGRLVYGPQQINGRIEQDPTISEQLSLWRQAGSQVIQGNLLVIPIEQSILYVQPLYLQATQTPIPQIKRVVVVYGNQVVMEPTLDGALARIFGGAQPTPVTPTTTPAPNQSVSALVAQAVQLYNQAISAQKAGDWASYGNLLNQLQNVLNQLSKAAPTTP
jgi:uncharacterized membrane protein (UPF0182 family)